MNQPITLLFALFTLFACRKGNEAQTSETAPQKPEASQVQEIKYDTVNKTIHIFVALCDNQHQGIVPVPEKIGNGQDPDNNLYWGCGYGIRTYFKKSSEWKLITTSKPGNTIMERLVFKHVTKPKQYLVADAYDGRYIKQCTEEFLRCSAGKRKEAVEVDGTAIGISGNAELLAYIGHDGLMDFSLDEEFENSDGRKRDVIILACFSKMHFGPHLKNANVNPLVWTSHLMAPEPIPCTMPLRDTLTERPTSRYVHTLLKPTINSRSAVRRPQETY